MVYSLNFEASGRETNNAGLLEIGKCIANETADRLVRIHRAERETGGIARRLDEMGATGHQLVVGDLVADEVIKGTGQEVGIGAYLIEKGIGRVRVYTEDGGIYSFGEGDKGVFIAVDNLDGSHIIDPNDPTPNSAVSVAMGRLSDLPGKDSFDSISVGVARDVFKRDLYFALKGDRKAHYLSLNDGYHQDLVVPSTEDIPADAKFAVDMDNVGEGVSTYQRVIELEELLVGVNRQRRIGSSVLDACSVAQSNCLSFVSWGGRVKFHDIAATQLIVREYGGKFHAEPVGENAYQGNLLELMFCGDEPSDEIIEKVKATKFRVVFSRNDFIHKFVLDRLGLGGS